MFKSRYHKAEESDVDRAVAELKAGSAEAFHLLYDKYHQKVYKFCLRMLGDKDSADDAFQEAFIKVYEHRREFRGNNFAAWLFTIVRHTCLNIIRARKEHVEFDEEFHLPSYKPAESDIGMQEYISQAIAKLPVSFREALILREYEECSYQDIAEILNIDLSLAKVRVHRARIILRKLLTPLVKEIYES